MTAKRKESVPWGMLKEHREAVIEECARTCEAEIRGPDSDGDTRLVRYLASAIRALKDKP